jgi:hypothetical protein
MTGPGDRRPCRRAAKRCLGAAKGIRAAPSQPQRWPGQYASVQ